MKRLLLALLVCTGCDKLFGVERIDLGIDAASCDPFNEDGDRFGNACDACPADADDGTDVDADEIGDLCDPDRMMAGDRMVLFDGFDTNVNPWTITGGWQRQNGAFELGTTSDSRVELSPVSARVPTMLAVIPTYSVISNGGITIFGSMGGSDVRCSVTGTPGNETLSISAFLINDNKPLTGTGPLRIYGGQRRDGHYYCRARHGANFDVDVTSAVSDQIRTIDKIGIVTSQTSATVTSVTLYDVP
ncbi:MAG TPA: hypothetical protein VL326_09835 [Kofleriaceae bacterium]|jgi:hypothetical protein|nr:hypothetical protein [Kofleriaceae bacterium]